MNKSKLLLLIILIVVTQPLFSQISGFNKVKWERERIAPGLTWKSTHSFLED
jgi:hypothetical protein